MKSLALVLFLSAHALLLSSAAHAEILYLQPLGKSIEDADVDAVKRGIVEFYGLEVKVLPRVPLPKAAWYPPRQRWRAEKILEFLDGRMPEDGMRILGLTAEDISTTKGNYDDWGVLGLGELPGKAGVISSFRARRRAADKLVPRERLAKVAVHEIGHTLGLDHCPTPGCLMQDAEGSVTSCDVEFDLCPRCREKLGARVREHPRAPWRGTGSTAK